MKTGAQGQRASVFPWNSIIGFSYATGDTSDSITIATYGNGIADAIFKVCPVQECHDGLRNTVLTCASPRVGGPDLITVEMKIVAYFMFNSSPDFFFICSHSCHKDGKCCRLGTFDTFRMVMRAFGALLCFCQNVFLGVKSPSDRSYTHCRPITTTVIRTEIILS